MGVESVISKEAWYLELIASKKDILQYLSGPVIYGELPPHYQASIREYTTEGFPDEGEFRKHMTKYHFLIGDVPTEALVKEIERIQGGRGEINPDFQKYHSWYVEERTRNFMPDYGPKNRWPVTLSEFYEEEVLEDGWHRFHDYYRKDHKTIPVMEWVKVK